MSTFIPCLSTFYHHGRSVNIMKQLLYFTGHWHSTVLVFITVESGFRSNCVCLLKTFNRRHQPLVGRHQILYKEKNWWCVEIPWWLCNKQKESTWLRVIFNIILLTARAPSVAEIFFFGLTILLSPIIVFHNKRTDFLTKQASYKKNMERTKKYSHQVLTCCGQCVISGLYFYKT